MTAEQYRIELAKRGVSLDVSAGDLLVSVTLAHGNGRERSLVLKRAEDEHLEIFKFHPRPDAADYRSTDGVHYTVQNYSDDIFTAELQRLIDQHLREADQYEGVR